MGGGNSIQANPRKFLRRSCNNSINVNSLLFTFDLAFFWKHIIRIIELIISFNENFKSMVHLITFERSHEKYSFSLEILHRVVRCNNANIPNNVTLHSNELEISLDTQTLRNLISSCAPLEGNFIRSLQLMKSIWSCKLTFRTT